MLGRVLEGFLFFFTRRKEKPCPRDGVVSDTNRREVRRCVGVGDPLVHGYIRVNYSTSGRAKPALEGTAWYGIFNVYEACEII